MAAKQRDEQIYSGNKVGTVRSGTAAARLSPRQTRRRLNNLSEIDLSQPYRNRFKTAVLGPHALRSVQAIGNGAWIIGGNGAWIIGGLKYMAATLKRI